MENSRCRFSFSDHRRYQNVEVKQLLYFNNFGDAWFTLRERLIPTFIENVMECADAIKIYSKFNSEEEIAKNGVVVIELKVVE